ncbi:MAG: hypothetical protein KDD70_13635, partial [Bdellovibrionales bacterium]|nr:hypothetical protein [Bdellovibrionales bacterium]
MFSQQQNGVLWTPTSRRLEESKISNFISKLNLKDVVDFSSLYHWSVEHPEQFWRTAWEECRILGDFDLTTDTVFKTGLDFRSSRWFPKARLNFAENMLWRRGAEQAITFYGEEQTVRKVSW